MSRPSLRVIDAESQADDDNEATIESKCEQLLRSLENGGQANSFPLQASRLNTFASHPATKKSFRDLARRVHQLAFRELMPDMKGAAWPVYCAVCARTFGFSKIAETITYDQLRFGLREGYPDGPLKLDGDRPIFRGCGIASEATLTTALNALADNDLVGRWAFSERSKPYRIYTPVPVWLLRFEVLGPLVVGLRSNSIGPTRWRQLREALCVEFRKATAVFEDDLESVAHLKPHRMLPLVGSKHRDVLTL